MLRSFYASRRWALWAWGGGAFLLLSLWLQVSLTLAINQWYGGFYDLLQNAGTYKDDPAVGVALFFDRLIGLSWLRDGWSGSPSFLIIACPYIVLATLTNWFTRLYGLRWREALTRDYIPRWSVVTTDIEGASQRIQEDCNRFARIVESLGLQAVRAVMTLIAFIPILWDFSSRVDLPLLRDIQGALVWGALLASLGGLAISWLVSLRLPILEYDNQKAEAAFRKQLVLGEDDKRTYAQPESLFRLFVGLRGNYQRLYLHYGYFDAWITLYDQVMTVVPYLLMGPGLFSGALTLGVMVQVSNAFARVHGGFALFLNNWTTITELRSIIRRLREFERHLAAAARSVAVAASSNPSYSYPPHTQKGRETTHERKA